MYFDVRTSERMANKYATAMVRMRENTTEYEDYKQDAYLELIRLARVKNCPAGEVPILSWKYLLLNALRKNRPEFYTVAVDPVELLDFGDVDLSSDDPEAAFAAKQLFHQVYDQLPYLHKQVMVLLVFQPKRLYFKKTKYTIAKTYSFVYGATPMADITKALQLPPGIGYRILNEIRDRFQTQLTTKD